MACRMRLFSFTIGFRILLVTALLSATFAEVAVPQKRRGRSSSKSSSRRSPTAKEAGAASVKKVQLRKQLQGMQGQMRQVKARIHQAKAKENRITETIETVNARISRTKNTLSGIRTRLRTLGNEHDEVVQRLDETERRLAQRRALLSRRVRDNYQRGEATYLHVLIQSRSLKELLSRNHYVRHIVRSDAELIEGVKKDVAQIAADKRRLEAQQREQQSLENEYEARKADYVRDRTTQREMLSNVQEVRHEAEDELDDLEAEAHAMTSRIRALTEMLRRREEALRQAELARRRRAREKARLAQKARGQKPKPETHDDSDLAPRSFRGGFIRPVGGRITSGFGYRHHPILRRRKLHTGVDFGVPHGTSIRAAASGTVLLAGYSGGYGKCVIIYHGDGVSTLYGHCSSLNVSEGQEVKQGQVIARVGSTGMSTGPHLHFEVRRNGSPVRPF